MLAPLVLAVVTVAAGLSLAGVHLSILHLVGMLLIVAVGSNYALFFSTAKRTPKQATKPRLAAPVTANASTRTLASRYYLLSQVPVLRRPSAQSVRPEHFRTTVRGNRRTNRPCVAFVVQHRKLERADKNGLAARATTPPRTS